MRRSCATALAVLLCAITAPLAHSQVQPVDTAYDIEIALDPELHTISGTQHVTYANQTGKPVTTLHFALLANWGTQPNPFLHPAVLDEQYVRGFDPTYTRIHSVCNADGEPLSYTMDALPPFMQTYSLENGVLSIQLPSGLAADATAVIIIEFETKFAEAYTGDQAVLDRNYVWRFGWNPVLVGESAVAGRFELPAATYTVEFSLPDEYVVLAGADRQEMLSVENGTQTVRLSNERPVRSIPLVFGPSFEIVRGEWEGVEIVSATLDGGESFARIALTHIEELLESYANAYGRLPNRRILVVENPSPGFFGMAADGIVLVGSSVVRMRNMPALDAYARVGEYLLAHELAHLYWGIGIGTDFNAENWISEGFAEYLSITYFERKYGGFNPNLLVHLQPGLSEDLLATSFGYLNLRQHLSESQYIALLLLGFDEPIIQPMSESEYLNGLVARTYNKGYLVLRSLASILGEETMDEVLASAHESWQGTLVSTAGFQTLVESVSDLDLSRFFEHWLYGIDRFDPSLGGFESQRTAEGYSTTVQLAGEGDLFPLEIEAILEDGSTYRTTLEPGCCSTQLPPIATDSRIVSVHLDPGERLPDANRFNNHWPRRVLIDHPFRNTDAEEIGKPLDAYVLELLPFGIAGSFRSEHQWSLMALPHIDPDANMDRLDDLPQTLDLIGTFATFISRALQLHASLRIEDLDPATGDGTLDTFAHVQRSMYTNPEIGAAGVYWDPTGAVSLGFGLKGTTLAPIPYLELSASYVPLLTHSLATQVEIRLGIPGFGSEPFGSVEVSAEKRFRLGHLLYLDLGMFVAETLFEDLPNEFLFSMDRLHTFSYLPMGHHQQFGDIELTLPPLVRNAGYAILNLTRLDTITPSFFARGGRTQANCVEVCEPGIRVEAGVAVAFRFPLFLGTAIELRLGVAQPLIGMDGELTPFVEFGSPFGAN